MAEWYIKQQDNVEDLGPFSPTELLAKVRAGEVTEETSIRKNNSAWFAAREVGGLFEAARRPTIEYFCPQCETQVTEPPVSCHNCGREIRKANTVITENTIADPGKPKQASRSVQNWLRKKRMKKDDDA